MGRPETKIATARVMTGSRAYSWFEFPYCWKCKWHVTWSGQPGAGLVGTFGWLFAGGGAVGGVALGLAGESRSEGRAVLYAILFAIAGYLVCMALVALLGLVVARRKPECTSRGAAVHAHRTEGWQFRFTNPKYEDAFRGSNNSF